MNTAGRQLLLKGFSCRFLRHENKKLGYNDEVSQLISHAHNCITLLLGSFFSSELTSRETVQKFSKAGVCGDFPGGPVVKNLSSNAGHTGSIPSQGTKMPHAWGN